MEISAVEASDDRVDTGLVFIPVHCSLHQKPGRGSATIAVVNEQAPKEYGVQVLQVELAGQRDGACQDVGMEHAPDARAFHVVMIDPPGQPGVAAAQLAQYRSDEHTSELQSLMSIPYAVCCLK